MAPRSPGAVSCSDVGLEDDDRGDIGEVDPASEGDEDDGGKGDAGGDEKGSSLC